MEKNTKPFRNNTIVAPEMDELDILGKLMEQYYDGVKYNEDTKELSIPNEIIDEIMKS